MLRLMLRALTGLLLLAQSSVAEPPVYLKTGLAPHLVQFGTEWCSLTFNQISYSAGSVGASLRDMPVVRKMILEMMEDPLIPRQTKELIKRGLQSNQVDVRNLNAELRKSWNVPDDTTGFATLGGERTYLHSHRTWKEKVRNQETSNQVFSKGLRQDFQRAFGIAFPDKEPEDELRNGLITLVHELAHVRLENFLRKNIALLGKRYPESFIFQDQESGKFAINSQFKDLLHERYAFESEYKAFRATYGRYFNFWRGRYRKEDAALTEAEMSSVISDLVVDNYGITDPVVRAAARQPLRSLLSGGGELAREVDNVNMLIATRLFERSIAEYELSYALAEKALLKNGEIQLQPGPAYDALASFKRVLAEEDGVDSLLETFPLLLDRLKGTPGQKVILDFMSQEEVRASLAKTVHWDLPTSNPLSLSEVIQSHPKLKGQLGRDPYRFSDPTENTIAEMLRRMGTPAQPPTANGDFSVAVIAADRSRVIVKEVEALKELYTMPIKSGLEGESKLFENLKLDRSHPEEFWKRIGLKEEFERNFPVSTTFFESSESVVEIYRRLLKADAPSAGAPAHAPGR